MARPTSLLSTARAQLAGLGVTRPVSLGHLRAAVSAKRGVHIDELAGVAGHGVWLDTAGLTVVFTSTDPSRQLHDLAHVLLGHRPDTVCSSGIDAVHRLRGRATEDRIHGFTPQQETDAERARPALIELLAP